MRLHNKVGRLARLAHSGPRVRSLAILDGWFMHLTRIPPGCLLSEVFQALPTAKRPPARPRTC